MYRVLIVFKKEMSERGIKCTRLRFYTSSVQHAAFICNAFEPMSDSFYCHFLSEHKTNPSREIFNSKNWEYAIPDNIIPYTGIEDFKFLTFVKNMRDANKTYQKIMEAKARRNF